MPASAAAKETPTTRFAKDQLKAFIERVEKLEEEKKAISDDIRDVVRGIQGQRFRRQGSAHHRAAAQDGRERAQEQDAILETYMHALGHVEELASRRRNAGVIATAAVRPGNVAVVGKEMALPVKRWCRHAEIADRSEKVITKLASRLLQQRPRPRKSCWPNRVVLIAICTLGVSTNARSHGESGWCGLRRSAGP